MLLFQSDNAAKAAVFLILCSSQANTKTPSLAFSLPKQTWLKYAFAKTSAIFNLVLKILNHKQNKQKIKTQQFKQKNIK